MISNSVIEEEFDEVPQMSLLTSKMIVDAWDYLGQPTTPLSESGEKMMAVIIAAWEELFPEEAREWKEVRNRYKLNEMSITEQVYQRTGRSLGSYPYPIYAIMKRLFPKFQATERENMIKMVKRFPMFKFANKV